MNVSSSVRATAATIVLLALPIADFLDDGQVHELLIGALLILAFGGSGFAADKALKARVREWVDDDDLDHAP